MSTTESLRLSLDNANGEIQHLEAENRRLREAHPERVAEAELSTEVQRLKELYGQALEDIRKKDKQAEESRRLLEETTESLRSQEKVVQEAQTTCRDLEEKMGSVHKQVTQVQDAGELERHRVVEAERLKWEAREARLVAQLEAQTGSRQVETRDKPTSTPENVVDLAVTPTRGPTEVALRRRLAAEVKTAAAPECMPRSTGSDQVPPLAAFSGEEKDGINFRNWHEQLELVAGLCGWSDRVKLVNIATRLKGVAYTSIVFVLLPSRPVISRWWTC